MSTSDLTPLPRSLRVLNKAGSALSAIGVRPITLDADKLLAKAQKETGLSDYGDDSFREPLDLLLRSVEEEGRLNTMGRIIAKNDLLRLMRNRLKIIDTLNRNPEIQRQLIDRPLVVMGPPRTGTTIFHDLLACDSSNRVPLSWETAEPCPPPEAASHSTDPRIAKVQAELDQVDKLIPDFKKMHPMGAQRAQECVSFTSHHFTSMIFDVQYRVPSYEAWMNTADVTQMFKFHRQFLQLLQWKKPTERWALKSPQHLWHTQALLEEYPNACIVQTHRDPVRVLVSIASLIYTLRRLGSDEVSRNDIASHYAGWLNIAYENTIDIRKSGLLPPSQIIDLQFGDFVKDQLGSVKRVYQHFDLPLSTEAAGKIQAFVDDNPADKHGKHKYSLADTGLDLDELRALYKPYQDFFDIPSELV